MNDFQNKEDFLENLGLNNPKSYKIQETDCGDVASVDTRLNVSRTYTNDELSFYELRHLINPETEEHYK